LSEPGWVTNVWSDGALQEGSFELADVRPSITVWGLILEPFVLRAIMDMDKVIE